MRSIANLFSSFANLAGSVNALANVLDAATAKLRLQLAHEIETPAIERGEVIDNAGEPTPAKRNGRSKATA